MLGDTAVLGGGGSSGGGGDESGSGDAVAAIASSGGGGGSHEGAATAVTTGGAGSNSGDEERGRILEEGERSGSFGGNRWPRQETLALLRIRSDMDVAFRDASVKGPLWDEVSRKMAELGYHRSAKKCKEKFENVYKYHKRTKEGRSGKADGKTYRFFDQLEALENHPPTTHQSPKPPPLQQQQHSSLPPTPPSQVVTTSAVPLPTTTTTPTATTMAMPPSVPNTTLSVPPPHVTVPSKTTTTTTLPMAMPRGIVTAPSINLPIPSYPPPPTKTINPTNLFPHLTPNPTTTTDPLPHTTIPVSFPNIPTDLLSNSSSFSTSSDETLEGRRKRKRKWKDFFERLMKEVVEKQEQLQKRFLEAIEKREHDRMAREEAWRVQEMQRINRERDMLAQERSIAAAKDAAVMSLLQKIGEQQNLGQALNTISIVQPQPQSQQQPQPQSHPQQQSHPSSQPSAPQAPLPGQQLVVPIVQPAVLPVALAPPPPPRPQPQPQQQQQPQVTSMEIVKIDNNNGENLMPASSSRWPKVEVQALIKLRTSLDAKYQENGPKGPLWEEISSSMRKLGYNRNAKRCKEKWENINKYFKKVKESNKKRPEDSKTCPYFHQLDALYREKNKLDSSHVAAAVVTAAKPESMVAPLMVRPEQQWPPQPGPEVAMEDVENDPMDRHHHDEEDEDDEDEDKDTGDEEDEEDEGGGGGGNNYEIVSSKPASASMGTATAE